MMHSADFDKLIRNAFRVRSDLVARVQGDIRIRMEAQARAAGMQPKPWPDVSFVAGGVTGAKKRFDYAAIYALSDQGLTPRQISERLGASIAHVRSLVRERRLAAQSEKSA